MPKKPKLSPEERSIINKKNGALGGRPVGTMLPATLARREVEAKFNERVREHADELFNAQLSLAKGTSYVYRVDEKTKNGKKVREHVLVTDPSEIVALLDEHQGGDGMVDEHYYYITTKDPNSGAIDSLLNRGIGKPSDRLDIHTEVEIVPNEKLLELAERLNELKNSRRLHARRSLASNGVVTDSMDREVSN